VSSLIFHVEETEVLVATDTLAVSSHDKKPYNFTTKAFIVPHLRMIVAGTGVGGFLDRWVVGINSGMIVRGIDNLDYHTPRYLRAIWSGYEQEVPDTDSTTTVYHFGFSEDSGLIHSFAYRSTDNFQSEALGYGYGVKPECTLPDNVSFPDDIKTLMDEQRAIQRRKRKNKRVYIGGEIQIHHLTKAGFNVYTLAQFDDFDKDKKAIDQNFQERAASSQLKPN
jgi:hypothetical protein